MGVHKGLVALVAGMAVLIVIGLIAVAWGLVSKSGEAGLSGIVNGGPAGAFGNVDVPLADGESILSALPSAGPRRGAYPVPAGPGTAGDPGPGHG